MDLVSEGNLTLIRAVEGFDAAQAGSGSARTPRWR